MYEPDVHLHNWTAQILSVLGSATVTVRYKATVCDISLLLLKGDADRMPGRNWSVLLLPNNLCWKRSF